MTSKVVTILNYGRGNLLSMVNACELLGFGVRVVDTAEQILSPETLVLIFPGVGAFGQCMEALNGRLNLSDALRQYIGAGRPFFGVCVGWQCLASGSDENPDQPGLGVLSDVRVQRFSGKPAAGPDSAPVSVPHMGWNGIRVASARPASPVLTGSLRSAAYYFVHSYCVPDAPSPVLAPWTLATAQHGADVFVAVAEHGAAMCTQFHPEKSGPAGLRLLYRWIALHTSGDASDGPLDSLGVPPVPAPAFGLHRLARRVVAALDVRTNDDGDLVVTKGAQYDVREEVTDTGTPDNAANGVVQANKRARKGKVRNLGKPVELAEYYFREGADEICFLNITSFKNSPLRDFPMLDVLRAASKTVFVPLTVGGGIRDLTDGDGVAYPAVDVAAEYFRSGADKVSLGSDAVAAAEQWHAARTEHGRLHPEASDADCVRAARDATQATSISSIARQYGRQAVVVSVDPKRVPVPAGAATSLDQANQLTGHSCVTLNDGHTVNNGGDGSMSNNNGSDGPVFAWYQCTVRGGRETRDMDVVQLAVACEAMGAGELMVNCIDRDGTGSGFEHALMDQLRAAVSIPLVASSGAGGPSHFTDLFTACPRVEAALAAGMFHRREVSIGQVKDAMRESNFPTR